MTNLNYKLTQEEADTAALCIRLVISLWGHIDHDVHTLKPGFLTHIHTKLDSQNHCYAEAIRTKTKTTLYEWGLETIDPDDGDVMWTRHGDTLAKLLKQFPPNRFANVLTELRAHTKRLVLIKDTWTDADGLVDRRHAYITFERHAENVVFDQHFTGGNKVPQRFKKQFDAATSLLWGA